MPVYLFECKMCGAEEDVSLSVQEYEEFTSKPFRLDGKTSLDIFVHSCPKCGEELVRIYTSFALPNMTDTSRVRNKTEQHLILSMEKGEAFRKGGVSAVEELRHKRREKTHDKTGRREKSWRRKILGD